MNPKKLLLPVIICLVLLVAVAFIFANVEASKNQQPVSVVSTSSTSQQSIGGLSEYTDPNYGFSFWYPTALQVTATNTDDSVSYPGGVAVETLQVGPLGGTYVTVVNSPLGTITDEPNDHASPIPQTEYFFDSTSGVWMVAYPQGSLMGGSSGATTTATISRVTIGGLVMLPSGKRFDTTIIPLGTSRFLVIGDGGGSSISPDLAATVSQTGTAVNSSAQSAALQAESQAYVQANG